MVGIQELLNLVAPILNQRLFSINCTGLQSGI
jgi:hypothetical protein